jgi:hypothetical protein
MKTKLTLVFMLATALGVQARAETIIQTTTNWTPQATVTIPPAADVFMYDGVGASTGDVKALTSLLKSMNLTYATANTSQINAMKESDFVGRYKLILWPGGNSIDASAALSSATLSNVHNAVENAGIPYLGVCAGDIMAGALGSWTNKAFNLLNGVSFPNNYDKGIITGVAISFPKQSTLDITVWDGPVDTGWGNIVGKFPDGTPSIVEGQSGKGFVLLTAVHPEASLDGWCQGSSCKDNSQDVAYAKTLVNAAITRTPLPYFQ